MSLRLRGQFIAIAFRDWQKPKHRGRFSRVRELHRSRFREFAKCIALAFEQVCNLHAVAFANHAVLSRSLLQASRNPRDRFRDSRLVHRVRSFEHTASSRSRLRVRGRHRDRSGDSRKRKDIAVAFCKLRGHIAVAFAIRNTFIVAAFASTRHRRNHVCDLRNHLRSLLATRGIHRDRFSARSRTHRDHSCEVAGKRRAWLSSVLVAEADGAKS